MNLIKIRKIICTCTWLFQSSTVTNSVKLSAVGHIN